MKQTPAPASAGWAAKFFAIWTGQAFSLFGSALVQFALIWWITQKTGSATMLATASIFGLLPQILVGPFAGALVDRWNRRLVLICAEGGIAVVTLALALVFALGIIQPWHIFLAMGLRSLGSAFQWPAMQSTTPRLVPEVHLTRIAGLNQTLSGASTIVSPPAGALLLAALPIQGILVINIGLEMLAIVPLLFLSIPQPIRPEDSTFGTSSTLAGVWIDFRNGLAYLASWPELTTILVMATALNFLFNPAISLMPLLITKHFHGGALQLAWIESGWGAGVIVGGLLLSVWGGFRRKVITSLVGVIGLGLGVLIAGSAPSNAYPIAILGIAVSGLMLPMTAGPVLAVIQAVVRPDLQGRVTALVYSAAQAMAPVSLLVAGPTADLLGIRAWYWFGGGAAVLMGISGFFIPAILNIEQNAKKREARGSLPTLDQP
ncbi:MAG: MFS transporter [Anaerolineales bacterium]|jgi:DHA3 family macrolide efflux protein-like MFS transporter